MSSVGIVVTIDPHAAWQLAAIMAIAAIAYRNSKMRFNVRDRLVVGTVFRNVFTHYLSYVAEY
jgi:hypothetical protein